MKTHLLITATLVLMGNAVPMQAEPVHPQLSAKHTFMLGGYRQNVDGEFYAQPKGFDKFTLDFGELGVDDNDTSFMAEYRYRFNEQWIFTLGTYQFRTSGQVEGKRNFMFDGKEFEAGASLETELEVDTYMIEALYSVYKTDRAEILLGGGVHMFDFSAAIKSKIFVGELERTDASASDDILAPLPNLRAQAFYAFTSKWAVAATVGWLSAKYEDYDGSFTYLHARGTYNFTDHFGVGLGYQFVDVDLEYKRARGKSGFDILFNGPTAYLSYSF